MKIQVRQIHNSRGATPEYLARVIILAAKTGAPITIFAWAAMGRGPTFTLPGLVISCRGLANVRRALGLLEAWALKVQDTGEPGQLSEVSAGKTKPESGTKPKRVSKPKSLFNGW